MFTFRYRKEPSYSPFIERINGFIDVVAWTAPHLTVTAGFIVLLSAGIVTFWNKSGRLVKASFGKLSRPIRGAVGNTHLANTMILEGTN